jgi:hypothetical protein
MYPDGDQKSHWQTVLLIMSATPVPVQGDEVVECEFDIPYGKPATYKLVKCLSQRIEHIEKNKVKN